MKEQPENQNEKQKPPLPRHIARVIEETRIRAASQAAWTEREAKTPSRYE